MTKRKSFSDLVEMDALVIPGTWAAQAMGMNPTRLISYAREKPDKIRFEYQLSGNRMKVARIPFLKYWGITDEEIKNKKLR